MRYVWLRHIKTGSVRPENSRTRRGIHKNRDFIQTLVFIKAGPDGTAEFGSRCRLAEVLWVTSRTHGAGQQVNTRSVSFQSPAIIWLSSGVQ